MLLSIRFLLAIKELFIGRYFAGTARRTKTRVTRAAARVTRAKLVELIPKANLLRKDQKYLSVSSLCALSNNTVLLACPPTGLRALSLHTKLLSARDPIEPVVGNVREVAYEKRTDTLLLVVKVADKNWQLVSLRRKNADEWLEVQRLPINNSITPLPQLAICGSLVLLGGGNSYFSTMYVFDVSAEHNLSAAGTVALEDTELFRSFACTRLGNDTLFAFAYYGHVSLKRLELQSLKHLASANFDNPYNVIFYGNLLLVANGDNKSWNKETIQLLQVSGDRLTEQRELRGLREGIKLGAWTLVNDRLLFWDRSSETAKDLIVYTFT